MSPEEPQLTELAWQTRRLIDEQIGRFSVGQVAIMHTMLTVSRLISEKGEAAGVSVLTACLNAVMTGGSEIDVTDIPGFYPDKDISFESGMSLDDPEDSEDPKKTDNIIHIDWPKK